MLAPPASGNAPSPGGDVGTINTLVLEPSWLSSVACSWQADSTLVLYFANAWTCSGEFSLRIIHSLELLYCCPKLGIFQLVIPDKLGLRHLLLQEMHCNPLAGRIVACKVISEFQAYVWWPKLTVDICTFILGCVTC